MMSELAIPPEMIERRLRNFWGYGSFKAPVWLIGMEEGLSDQGERELLIRFRATDNKAMVDMRRDMGECSDHMEWFQPHCEIQRTWRFPIALYLALTKGRNPDIEEIREYQRTMLGDTNLSQTAVIELMPLPSKWADEGAWLYGKYRSLGLKTREHYMQAYKQGRVRALGALIDTHKPKLVIFYGSSLHNDWLAVAQVPVTEISPQMFVGQSNNTSFCFIPHSRSRKPIPMSYTRVFFLCRSN